MANNWRCTSPYGIHTTFLLYFAKICIVDVIRPNLIGAFGLSSALVLSVLGTLVSTAYAETIPFTAEVNSKVKKPVGCPEGAFLCGEAAIDGFGTAKFLYYLTGGVPTSNDCVDYTAVAIFTLADGSRLVLDESGAACGPGNAFFNTPPHSWGHPTEVEGSWTVAEGTGQFDGVTGSGTNTATSTGAQLSAVYTGALES